MNTDLLGFVLFHLKLRQPPWTEVAKEAGVPFDTLKKIGLGYTVNPGILHVQRLADYFSERLQAAKPSSRRSRHVRQDG